MEWLPDFVDKHLTFTGKCFRHCDKHTQLRVLSKNEDHLVGAYTCPEGAVSQVVYFSLKPDLTWFQKMLSSQVGVENTASRDIRLATRHGWELGNNAQKEIESKLGPGGAIKEAYWRMYPSTDNQNEKIVALCIGEDSKAGCLNLFMKEKESNEKLCSACRTKKAR
jgi:hypothetical protein